MNSSTDFIPSKYTQSSIEKGTFSWSAPSNIALVKYWGKIENQLNEEGEIQTQIPANPSVSFTLNSCKTETKKAENNATITTEEFIESPQLTLGEFDIKAKDFINKEVKVTGIVDHVCKHGGKKILLVTDDGDVHINSEERFEETLKGSEISVTGVVNQ